MIITVVIICVIIAIYASRTPPEFITVARFRQIAASDPYFQKMTGADLAARNSSSAPEYLARYLESAREWTHTEREWMRRVVREATRRIHASDIAFILSRWRFAKLGGGVEMGYPHTFRDVIVWTETTLAKSFDDQVGLAVHEQTHVWQRANPRETDRLIKKMGMRLTHCRPDVRTRNNPDQDQKVWIDRRDRVLGQRYTAMPENIASVTGVDHPMELMAYQFERLCS